MAVAMSFDEILESCLQELARTGDVESCLRRYPGQAEALRPLLETAGTVGGHYRVVPPAPGGLAVGRERFLAVAAQERARGISQASDTGKTVRMGWRGMRLSFARLFPILLVAFLGAAIFGGAVVWAANDSLPGELLYPVKLATEDVRLALPSTPQGQVGLTLDLVATRAGEIEALAQAGEQVPDGTVARMERHIERALTRAASASDAALDGLLLQITERTSTQAQRLERVQAGAAGPVQVGLQRAVAACWRGAAAAEAGLTDPQTFRWRYQHGNGETEPTQEPQGEQERHQEQNREREGEPSAAPQGPQAEPGPTVTPGRVRVMATPSLTPTVTVSTTLQGPQATAEPQPTPQGPQATAEPQPSPQGPQATTEPEPSPQGPGATGEPQPTPQGPEATGEPQPSPQGPQSTSEREATPQGPQMTSPPGGPGGGSGGDP